MSEKSISESLAAIVIANRVLGLFSDEAKSCMSELLRRREDDRDPFDFEKYIDDQIGAIEIRNEESRKDNVLMTFLSSLSSVRKSL
jgi:hypothetical protein